MSKDTHKTLHKVYYKREYRGAERMLTFDKPIGYYKGANPSDYK